MGWNDRNPELYDALVDEGIIHGPKYFDHTMPTNWQPPAMPEKCYACGHTGDTINDPIYEGECMDCDEPMCRHCGEVEGDEDGNTYHCKDCVGA